MSAPPAFEYLDTRDAARLIGLKPSTLETWRVRRSDGPVWTRAGRRVLYAVADLRAWMDANKRRSTSDRAALAA